jgi:hypothetical protein
MADALSLAGSTLQQIADAARDAVDRIEQLRAGVGRKIPEDR